VSRFFRTIGYRLTTPQQDPTRRYRCRPHVSVSPAPQAQPWLFGSGNSARLLAMIDIGPDDDEIIVAVFF
jgi:hypothetical protein